MSANVRAFRTAVLSALKADVTLVGGRVFTPPVPPTTPLPYLVLSSYSETPGYHHGGSDYSDTGCQIRGMVRSTAGDSPLLALWEQVHEALQDVELTVAGREPVIASVRYVTDFPEPSDPEIRIFVARCEGLVVA